MIDKIIITGTIFLLSWASTYSQSGLVEGSNVTVESPDKNLAFQFYQKAAGKGKRMMFYHVSYKGKPVIYESVLDFQLDNHLSESAMALKVDTHERWTENLLIKKISTSSNNTSWKPIVGEQYIIRDWYNAATIELVKDDNIIYPVHVQIRAYNEGIAIRYFFPENQKGTYYRVVSENTEFVLPEGTKAWHALWAQAPYKLMPLAEWPGESERPLTLELSNGLYACLAEAQMVDYSRGKFALSKTKPNTIVTAMHGPADLISPFVTPWRVVMVAEKASDLVANNHIILNLNEGSKISDAGWIKPGKIMRVMTQTTADAKSNIEFAQKHNLQYVLFDWKWYGPAFSFSSDASRVAIADFDLPSIISYGNEKGVGIWLYVNQQALLSQSDSLFAIYKKWGVKGVKFGFVQVGSHRWTTWLQKTIQQAAANNIMVNIHDDWRPTGEQRTWPNLMTSEGIRGNEEMPDATHNVILPFTRYIAGAADYTICYYDKRIKTTHAHQLAMAAVYYSPVQTLFWYDKPDAYRGEPEIEFFENIPTSWDETKLLHGEIGQYISVARRKGDEWFIGTMTNNEGRTVKMSFDFLPKDKKYTASIYSDDPKAATATKVAVNKKKIDSKISLPISLLPSGGHAIWLKPVK